MPSLPKYLTIKLFERPIGGYASGTRLIIDNLTNRYNQFISKDIIIESYIDGKNYVFKVKVPSEKNYKYKNNIFYDVIVEFYPIHNSKQEESKKIDEYGLRVFSNNPQSMFVFTYVWNKMDALYKKIPNSMYSGQALKEPTTETNPNKFVGIDKSIFYALRKIYDITKFNKDKIEKISISLPTDDKSFKFPGKIFDNILSQVDKLHEIQNIEKDRLEIIKKKKSSNSNKSSINKNTTNEDNRKNNLQSNFETNLKNSNTLKENNRLKSSTSSNLKSNLKK